jgi:hypothetical protein
MCVTSVWKNNLLLFPLRDLLWHVNSREVSTGEKLMKADRII